MENQKITLPVVGDEIFSKNDTEFYAEVTNISGQKVTVTFENECDTQTEVISITRFIDKCDDVWEFPNWTFDFEI